MSTITLPKVLANFETSLSASMSAVATTLTLKASVDGDAATLSGTYALTIDEGTSAEEHMYVTLAGASGTVTRRGLSKVDAWTEVTGNKLAHERGATVKITTFNVVLLERLLAGTDTFGAVDWTGVQSISGLATAGAGEVTKAASVAYVNAVAIAGASDATTTSKGIVEEATQAEIAAGTAAGSTAARLFTNPSTLAPHIQAGTWLYAVEDGTGSDDTYTWTTTPVTSSYTTPSTRLVKFTVANTGAATGNENSIGAKAIKKYVAGALADLETGDIVAGFFGEIYYDGTFLVLKNPGAAMPTTANLQSITTNLPTLTGGSTTDASALHYHPFFSSLTTSETSGAVTIFQLDPKDALFTQATSGTASTTNLVGGVRLIGGPTGGRTHTCAASSFLNINTDFDNNFEVSTNIQFETASATQNAFFGLGAIAAAGAVPDAATSTTKHVGFFLDDTTLYASNANGTTQTKTDITSGVTISNLNEFRIVYTAASTILFYVNGVLKATHSTNIPTTGGGAAGISFGIDDEATGAAKQMRVGYIWLKVSNAN